MSAAFKPPVAEKIKLLGSAFVSESSAERACPRGYRAVSRSLLERDGDDPVDHVLHAPRGKPEMAMPSVADHREQAGLGQLREVSARGLGRDARRQGQLARGQGTAIEQRRHHRGPRRVSDQRRDLGDDGAGDHVRYRAAPGSGVPSQNGLVLPIRSR